MSTEAGSSSSRRASISWQAIVSISVSGLISAIKFSQLAAIVFRQAFHSASAFAWLASISFHIAAISSRQAFESVSILARILIIRCISCFFIFIYLFIFFGRITLDVHVNSTIR
jgi:hypothetical protein